jgi:EmrB/QacA subfamily drug resistance transporter
MEMHRRRKHPAADTEQSSAGFSRWGLLVLLCLAQLMVILDISAVNVALPSLAKDLRIGHSGLSWTITSYSLVFGSLLLLGGRAADLVGRRRVFLTGLGVFTFASVGSALAGSSAVLFAARAGQGLGAALLSPAALSIITSRFKGPERVRALGVWGVIGGAGAAIGVLIGGLLTELIDWRAIFLINLPIGLIVAVGAAHVVPADKARPNWRALDLRGAVLATASVGALVFAFSQAQSAGWTATQTLGLTGAGLAGLVGFALSERRVALPLLKVERLADRAIGGGFVMMLAATAVLFGSFLLSSLYLQQVLGYGALVTGLAFLPFALATAAGVHLATHVISQRGVRAPLVGGFATTALGMFLLTGVGAHGSYAGDLLPGMLIAGVGIGVVLVSVAFSVLSGAREEETGMLSGLNTTGHEVGGSVGLAVLTTIATGSLGHAHGPAATIAISSGIGNAFLAAGIIASIASIAALVILPSAKSFLPKLELAPPITIH